MATTARFEEFQLAQAGQLHDYRRMSDVEAANQLFCDEFAPLFNPSFTIHLLTTSRQAKGWLFGASCPALSTVTS
jgi:hypothetical protein